MRTKTRSSSLSAVAAAKLPLAAAALSILSYCCAFFLNSSFSNHFFVFFYFPLFQSGKFGVVRRCTEKTSNKSLAAKFIETSSAQDRKDVEREVDIMCSLQHPRLLQLYDAFDDGRKMCLIMEW